MDNIYQKIHKVMQDIEYLKKDDHVKFGKTDYKAISEEKVTSAVRPSLIKHGIVIIPIEQNRDKVGNLSAVDTKYRIQNIDDVDDYVIAASSGEGADTQDKGAGKAMTYSYKYLLLRTFAIPTGEDPDKVSSEELDAKEKEMRINLLKSMIVKTNTDEKVFLNYYKVNKAEDLNEKQFEHALNVLNKKQEKQIGEEKQ